MTAVAISTVPRFQIGRNQGYLKGTALQGAGVHHLGLLGGRPDTFTRIVTSWLRRTAKIWGLNRRAMAD